MADNVEKTNSTKGSEEVTENCCSPCLKDGKKKEARKFCVDCGSHVCDQCVQDHKKFLALRSHQILDKFEQRPRKEIETDGKETVFHLTRCTSHHGKLIDRFCGEHKELCCASCVAIKHRSCGNVGSLCSFVKEDFKESSEYREIREVFESVKTKAAHEQTKRKEYLLSLNTEKDKLLQSVQNFQDDIIDRVKDVAETSRQKIIARHAQYKTTVELDIVALETIGSTMDAYSVKLSEDDAEKLFLNAQAGRTAAKEGECLICELPSDSDWKKSLAFCFNLELKQKVENFELLAETTRGVREACDFMEHLKILQQILKSCQCLSHQYLLALLHLYSIPLMGGIQSDGKLEHVEPTDNKVGTTKFQGFLQTAHGCRKCQNVCQSNIQFHHLSIPLRRFQEGQMRTLNVIWVPSNPREKPVQFKLAVPKNGCVDDLCDVLSCYVHVGKNSMVVTDVYNHRFHKFFAMTEKLSQIMDRDGIFIYEVAVNENPNLIMLPIYMREERDPRSQYTYLGTYQLFGQPYLVLVPQQCTYTKLYNLVLQRFSRFVSAPGVDDNNWWRDQSTPHNEDSAFLESSRKIFRFSIVDSYGTAGKDYKLKDDGSPLKLNCRMYISMDWCTVAKDKFYDEKKAKSFEIHETMRGKGHDIATLLNHNITQCFEQLIAQNDGETSSRYCQKCKKEKPATKKTDLLSLPNILIIQLDKPFLGVGKDAFVDFPLRDLDLSKYVKNESEKNCQFDLIGVVNHDGGSYTSYCRNVEDSKWHYLDQRGITESTEKEVVTNKAYGLVYQRREP